MKRLLLAAGFVLALASPVTPAQAQTRIEIDCDSVEVIFRTSIQPESATVEIQSNAGTETHNPTLAQGGSTVSFPFDGQNGESVTVNVTLVHAGIPNTISASEILEGCDEETPNLSPSPSPSPPAVVETPSPALTVEEVGVQPSVPVAPVVEASPVEEGVSAETVEQPLPEELAFTGFSQVLGLLILAGSLIGLGLYARSKGYRRAR